MTFTRKQLATLYAWAITVDPSEAPGSLAALVVASFAHPLPPSDLAQLRQYCRLRTEARRRYICKFVVGLPTRSYNPERKVLGEAVAAVINNRATTEQVVLVLQKYNVLPVGALKKLRESAALKAYQRNSDRFARGEWVPPVWAEEAWYVDHPMAKFHQAHVSTKDSAMVAFTQTADKMVRDIQTPMKPGRYLSTYFSDVLSESEIRHWANLFTTTVGRYFDMHVLKNDEWEGSEDELRAIWERIYDEAEVDYSCMRGKYAPSVYGMVGNHLGLVTWTKRGAGNPFLSEDVPTFGRTIIRTDRDPHEYIRVYPFANTEPVGTEHGLQAALSAAGFHHGRDLGGIHLIYEKFGDGIVCPYLDGSSQRVEVSEYNGRETLRIGTYGTPADSQSGVLEIATCDECGDTVDSEDLTFIESEEISVCPDCRERYFVVATDRRSHQVYIRADDAIYCESNDTYYTERGAEYHDIVQIDYGSGEGDWYHVDDTVYTSRGFILVQEAVQLNHADPEGFYWAHEDDVVETENGLVIHVDDAITSVDGKTYYKYDDLLSFEDGGGVRYIHKEAFDPEDFIVVGNTLLYDAEYYPQRGGMSLVEWMSFHTDDPKQGILALANVNAVVVLYSAWVDWMEAQNTERLAA